MDYRVGQKIVCIRRDDKGWKCDEDGSGPSGEYPRYRKVYQVSGIWGEHLFLTEIPAFEAWNKKWFRPLVEKKTSIEIFQKLLAPTDLEKV